MISFSWPQKTLQLNLSEEVVERLKTTWRKNEFFLVVNLLVYISIVSFAAFHSSGLAIAYNDARSHLNIGRRVVEGLTPGLAQLGSVWLPLPHALMIPTIWNDFMWHSGLAGAIVSMTSYVLTGVLIYRFMKALGVGSFGRVVGVIIFAANTNVIYLQSTAMTELLLLFLMMAGAYEFFLWHKDSQLFRLFKSAFFIMLATLVRYDAWFLLAITVVLLGVHFLKRGDLEAAEGYLIAFATLGGFGILLWFFWNLLIFKDPFYFVFGPFSAHAQQQLLEAAGELPTKGKLFLSVKYYLHALLYNQGAFIAILGAIGLGFLLVDKAIKGSMRLAAFVLLAPFFFNVLALFLGHSVLFIQGLSGDTWFNVRYGIMMAPAVAILVGYLLDKLKKLRAALVGLIFMTMAFSFISKDAVTIDDALHGASQKNVSEVSGWLRNNAQDKEGFILISAASHDAIIFSSGLPMKRFIHEGTGEYWRQATVRPALWARYIIMRTHDNNDLTFKAVSQTADFERYRLVANYPFADVYELTD